MLHQTADFFRGSTRGCVRERRKSTTSCQARDPHVATKILTDYRRLQRPARHNVVFSKALEDFTGTAVLAYQCGYSEGLLREELRSNQDAICPSGDLDQEDIENCILSLALVWITLSLLPASASKRWATGQAVSEPTRERWGGFVQMIVRGYFDKRWAAYPIDRLQTEIALVTGRLERPSVVAEWSRLVYCALETAAPQWPSK